jgi:hypothetical protein
MTEVYTPPQDPPPPPPPLTPWNKGQANLPPMVPPPSGNPPPPPPVPGKGAGGNGPIIVHTSSLEVFAENIASLVPLVQKAIVDLGGVSVQPGAFYHADNMRQVINGQNADAGLKGSLLKVLNDLANALQNLHDEALAMSQKYKTFDDMNTMDAGKLKDAFSTASDYFAQAINDGAIAAPK